MYRFLLTPRWLALLVVAALSVPGCILLASWQFDRLGGAQRTNEEVRVNSSAPPAAVAEIATVGGAVAAGDEWRAVTVTGRYDEASQLLVRNRPRDGAQGFHVLTPVVTADGPAALVNRGWVGAGRAGGSPDVPPAPAGEVTVTGLLRPADAPAGPAPGEASDLPAGQVLSIDVPRIDDELPLDLYAGYIQLVEQDPGIDVVAGMFLPNPLSTPGSESELLHRSYAWQWYVFAAIGPLGVALLARREAADRTRPAAGQAVPAPRVPTG